jgi:hypothetical protein
MHKTGRRVSQGFVYADQESIVEMGRAFGVDHDDARTAILEDGAPSAGLRLQEFLRNVGNIEDKWISRDDYAFLKH